MSEGDLVANFAAQLRQVGWRVVVARPNNTSIWFRLADGRRKGPDIVAVGHGRVLIAEAKVRSSDLIRTSSSGVSDLAALSEFLNSNEIQREFMEQLRVRVRGEDLDEHNVQGAVVMLSSAPAGAEMYPQISWIMGDSEGKDFAVVLGPAILGLESIATPTGDRCGDNAPDSD
jgi:Holliday junction resolvase